jgi:hypothetical protein
MPRFHHWVALDAAQRPPEFTAVGVFVERFFGVWLRMVPPQIKHHVGVHWLAQGLRQFHRLGQIKQFGVVVPFFFRIKAKLEMSPAHFSPQFAPPVFGIKAKRNGGQMIGLGSTHLHTILQSDRPLI